MTLTADQRWLLRLMGGWQLVWALDSEDGIKRLFASAWGRAGHKPQDGAPEWLTGFEIRGKQIDAPAYDRVPKVSITVKQLREFATSLPGEIQDELSACRSAGIAEAVRTHEWCRCPYKDKAPNAHSGPCKRYHPTEAEDQAHRDEYWRVVNWEGELIDRALGFDAEPVGQLELFEVAS